MGERLNTQDLIDQLVNNQGLDRKKTENFIKEFFSLIEEALEKNKSVKIKGFGTFKLVDVDSRESVNVNTGERINIQGHTKITFIPDQVLKDTINKPFAHFETVVLNDDVDFSQIQEEDAKDNSEIEENEIRNDWSEEAQPNDEEVAEIAEIVDEKIDTNTINTDNDDKRTEEEEKGEEKEEIKSEIKKSSNRSLIIVVLLAVLFCGGLLFFIYFDDLFPPTTKQPVTSLAVEKDSTVDEKANDSIHINESTAKQVDQKDVVEVAKNAEATAVIKPNAATKPAETTKPTTTTQGRRNTVPFSKIPVNPDSTSYDIVGTRTVHTITDGESLIRLSYKYYGTKDLYPYIIKHNSSTIKNPNNVPIGSRINIPELKKK